MKKEQLKKIAIDLLKVVCGAIAGYFAGGCISVPFFNF